MLKIHINVGNCECPVRIFTECNRSKSSTYVNHDIDETQTQNPLIHRIKHNLCLVLEINCNWFQVPLWPWEKSQPFKIWTLFEKSRSMVVIGATKTVMISPNSGIFGLNNQSTRYNYPSSFFLGILRLHNGIRYK